VAQICTKSFVGWGFAPDPTGELTVLPRPPNWFSGWGRPQQKGRREGRGKGGGKGREGVPECPNSELASLEMHAM